MARVMRMVTTVARAKEKVHGNSDSLPKVAKCGDEGNDNEEMKDVVSEIIGYYWRASASSLN